MCFCIFKDASRFIKTAKMNQFSLSLLDVCSLIVYLFCLAWVFTAAMPSRITSPHASYWWELFAFCFNRFLFCWQLYLSFGATKSDSPSFAANTVHALRGGIIACCLPFLRVLHQLVQVLGVVEKRLL